MQPEFSRTHNAIHYTLEYYNIDKIKDHLRALADPDRSTKSLSEWYDLIFVLHNRMEDDINQVIYTNIPATQDYFFNNLKEWLSYYLISDLHIPTIIKEVETYNNNIYEEFISMIKIKEDVLKNNYNPQLKENEEYEISVKRFGMGLGLMPFTPSQKTEKRFNRKYYCIEERLELLDTAYLYKYYVLVNRLLVNLRKILNKYISLYDTGKLPTNVYVQSDKKNLENNPTPNLLPPPKESKQKLKVKLSVPQLAYLFKILNDAGLLNTDTFKEIHEFISKNFIVSSKGINEDISSGKISRIWNNFDVRIISYWTDKFIDLHKLSKKDNPNNIK